MINNRYYGINPPFLGGAQGVLSRQVDDRLIKNDLLQLILTLPGERVHRPAFGTLLRAIPFDTMDDAGLSRLALNIETAIETYEDRVIVDSVTASLSDEGLTVNVFVAVSLVSNPLTKYFIEIAANQGGSIKIVR